ncbi:hypothetical protein DPEC_G00347910, partial [Dallia pectoralis]
STLIYTDSSVPISTLISTDSSVPISTLISTDSSVPISTLISTDSSVPISTLISTDSSVPISTLISTDSSVPVSTLISTDSSVPISTLNSTNSIDSPPIHCSVTTNTTISDSLIPTNPSTYMLTNSSSPSPNHFTSPMPTNIIHPSPEERCLDSEIVLLSTTKATNTQDAENIERNKETEDREEDKEDGRVATKNEEHNAIENDIGETMKEGREGEEGLKKASGILRQGGEGIKSHEEEVLCEKQRDEKEFETEDAAES